MFPAFQNPRMHIWQGRIVRLRTMPRWAWIAVLLGIVVPMVVVVAVLLVIGLASGLLIFLAIAVFLAVANAFRRLLHRPRVLDDGRRNVKIVVHSARVIDP